MTKLPMDLISELRGLIGEQNVIADSMSMARFINEPRNRFKISALAVALPQNVQDVQLIMAWANEKNVPIIPQAGNTGLVGGQVPLHGNEIIVNVSALNAMRSIEAQAGYMCLEAGVTLEQAHSFADEHDALFPLYIAPQSRARIGGMLGSNAGGIQVLSYGNARELCLGIEAVLPDGSLYNGLSALKKNNTGYDLKDLFIGSEGTLGIITAATLKLFPKPAFSETAYVSVQNPTQAFALFSILRARFGQALTAFELLPRIGIELQLKHHKLTSDPTASISPWNVMFELSMPNGAKTGQITDAIQEAISKNIISAHRVARSAEERTLMWDSREQMSSVQSAEGASIKHDVSVPVALVPELIARGIEAALRILPDIRPVPFGHLGDGNIHFNFSQPEGVDGPTFMSGAQAIHDAIYEVVIDLGGSVSAEHGIGQIKTALLKQVKDPVAYRLMRHIKHVFDPKGILNPGKLLE